MKNKAGYVDVVVDGAFGDSGKGKSVAWLAKNKDYSAIVKAGGGPQAGHTIDGKITVCQIPSGFGNPNVMLYIGRGTVINPKIVLKEIKDHHLEGRCFIDAGCTIIEEEHLKAESSLVKRIGSVGTGVGPARVDRIMRTARLAKDIPELKQYITDVSCSLNRLLLDGKNVLIEGVQGFGLSLMNHNYYPMVTSQDTTASQFLSDSGIGPKYVRDVFVITKAYTTRVGPGKLYSEWSHEEKVEKGVIEYGTISGRERRAGPFDWHIVEDAIIANSGTKAILTCVDRIYNEQELDDFVTKFNNTFKDVPFFEGITLISCGPKIEEMYEWKA